MPLLSRKTKSRCKKVGEHTYVCKRENGGKKSGAKAKWDKQKEEPVVVDEYGENEEMKKEARKEVKDYTRENEKGIREKKQKEFAEL